MHWAAFWTASWSHTYFDPGGAFRIRFGRGTRGALFPESRCCSMLSGERPSQQRTIVSWHMSSFTFMAASGKNWPVSTSFIVGTKQKTDGIAIASLYQPPSGHDPLVMIADGFPSPKRVEEFVRHNQRINILKCGAISDYF